MRRIGVVTVARSDYGIYRPILRAMQKDKDLELKLVVGGMHLSPEFGYTVAAIEPDGFEIAARVEMLLSSDSPQGVAKSMGVGVIGFAQAYAHLQLDLLLLLGDRFEMMSAAVAALPFRTPIAHIHGGESTEGAIDEAIRHAITKMSHIHFASTEAYARRIVQMGEEPWRVVVSGAPSLDNLGNVSLIGPKALEERFRFDLKDPTLLITYHPVTLEYEDTIFHVDELLAALKESGFSLIFTFPNADTHGRIVLDKINSFVRGNPRSWVIPSLGSEPYFSLMATAVAMVGNSSSGILEAASFKLPVVNIGTRQRGRIHGRNVLDVGYTRAEILEGIRHVTTTEFKESLNGIKNPYGDGNATEKIIAKLKTIPLDKRLLLKHFHTLP
jgi:UDP-hydrolysing UDP-N-acetyl-D-glucosamine 2-epimerase